MLVDLQDLNAAEGTVVFDCRFSLVDPNAGRSEYLTGHIPGAHYLDLNRDLSAPVERHGGRHPLPTPEVFADTLARFGVDKDTPVVAYDDSRFAFASRLWWMMRSLGFRAPGLLNGGYSAWIAAGGEPQTDVPTPTRCAPPSVKDYKGKLNIDDLREAMAAGAMLVDSREAARYEGLEEPIDPVAGHIPGAVNRPWAEVTDGEGRAQDATAQRERWGELLEADPLVVYCGSGVTACVNLFSLSLIGRDDAQLYAGSWSDWCSYLEPEAP